MADPILNSMLVHPVDVYHRAATVTQGQQTEAYSAVPDLASLPFLISQDGQELERSPVGALINSDAIGYAAEDAAIKEFDKITWGTRTFIVNGTPSRIPDPFDASGTGPIHHLEIGLKEQRWQP